MFRLSSTLLWALVIFPGFGAAQSRTEIETAMKEASRFFVEKVARNGGYVYYTSPDLSRRLGEGPATDTQIWVQPPGTPTVGMSLIEAYQATGDRYYLEAARKAATALIYGLVLAQMPAPQPGWAQQYNYDMEPIWARKFEPPAISGRETASVIEALLRIAVATREKRYLEPIGPAIEWLRESTLKSENRLARYYELRTNRPLYMFRRGDVYELTYDDSRLPGHYGWKTASRVSHLEAALDSVYDRKPLPLKIFPDREPAPTAGQVISSLDTEGAWISRFANEPLPGQPKFQPGEAYIHSGIFARNLEILSRKLASQ